MQKNISRSIMILLFILLLSVGLFIIIYSNAFPFFTNNHETWSEFGTIFGGIFGPIFSFFTLFFIIFSFYFDKRDSNCDKLIDSIKYSIENCKGMYQGIKKQNDNIGHDKDHNSIERINSLIRGLKIVNNTEYDKLSLMIKDTSYLLKNLQKIVPNHSQLIYFSTEIVEIVNFISSRFEKDDNLSETMALCIKFILQANSSIKMITSQKLEFESDITLFDGEKKVFQYYYWFNTKNDEFYYIQRIIRGGTEVFDSFPEFSIDSCSNSKGNKKSIIENDIQDKYRKLHNLNKKEYIQNITNE